VRELPEIFQWCSLTLADSRSAELSADDWEVDKRVPANP